MNRINYPLDKWHLGYSEIGCVLVSTIEIGVPTHDGATYETMVFRVKGHKDGMPISGTQIYERRHMGIEDAKDGHEAACKRVVEGELS